MPCSPVGLPGAALSHGSIGVLGWLCSSLPREIHGPASEQGG